MVPNFALELIDRKLKELMENNLHFGGKIVIISGDFRQILPVQKRAGRSELVSLSIVSSDLLYLERQLSYGQVRVIVWTV
jgi:hypothetical protein